jgi:leucyl/phenylalanyl-tRNA--protein transferase
MSDQLSPRMLMTAYAHGYFPMDVDGEVRWFSPDPRAVLPLDGFHMPRTLRTVMRSGRFEIRADTRFDEVVAGCAGRREGTWISREIRHAYTRLHRLGLAHSVEAWREGELAGGLYGVALGGAFFGESMYHRRRDASKVALAALVERLRARGYRLLDVQFTSPHLERFGVVEIPRDEYMRRLAAALRINPGW